MSDTTLNQFISRGTNAQRVAFTPSPATPATGNNPSYIFYETDTGNTYMWDGSAWQKINTGSGTSGPIPAGLGGWEGMDHEESIIPVPNQFGSGLPGVVPPSGGGTSNFLRADGTWASPSGSLPAMDGAKCRKSANATAQNITAGAYITFNSNDWDTGNGSPYHSTSSNTDRMTANNAGYYTCGGEIVLTSITADTWFYVEIDRFNSGGTLQETVCVQYSSVPTLTGVWANCSGIVHMNAGDYCKLFAQIQSNTSITITTDSWFSMTRIA